MSEHMVESEVREWRFNLNTQSAESVGNRILNLTMFSPNQVFRMFRAEGELVIQAVEGDVWESQD
tara:strand:+ start:469 stop:663 length:195 start_codon:yes stop_codon:yes gene_type:complete